MDTPRPANFIVIERLLNGKLYCHGPVYVGTTEPVLYREVSPLFRVSLKRGSMHCTVMQTNDSTSNYIVTNIRNYVTQYIEVQ